MRGLTERLFFYSPLDAGSSSHGDRRRHPRESRESRFPKHDRERLQTDITRQLAESSQHDEEEDRRKGIRSGLTEGMRNGNSQDYERQYNDYIKSAAQDLTSRARELDGQGYKEFRNTPKKLNEAFAKVANLQRSRNSKLDQSKNPSEAAKIEVKVKNFMEREEVLASFESKIGALEAKIEQKKQAEAARAQIYTNYGGNRFGFRQ